MALTDAAESYPVLKTQMFSRFRFRSPQRDRGTDQGRRLSIHQAIRAAIVSAERELRGLQARLDNARQSAASLLGNDFDGGDREPHHEAELTAAEGRLLAAEGRIRQLTDHLAALRRIEVFVNGELTSQA
jgi:hypothetical protein